MRHVEFFRGHIAYVGGAPCPCGLPIGFNPYRLYHMAEDDSGTVWHAACARRALQAVKSPTGVGSDA